MLHFVASLKGKAGWATDTVAPPEGEERIRIYYAGHTPPKQRRADVAWRRLRELANNIIDAGNTIRVANFKAQALRDAQIIEKVLPQFDVIETNRQKLLKLSPTAEDIRQLDSVKQRGGRP